MEKLVMSFWIEGWDEDGGYGVDSTLEYESKEKLLEDFYEAYLKAVPNKYICFLGEEFPLNSFQEYGGEGIYKPPTVNTLDEWFNICKIKSV